MAVGFIDDGYSESGFIAEEPGLYPAVTFTFRPMLPTEYGQFLGRLANDNEEKARHEMARWISTKLVEWDLRDSRGNTVEITPQNVVRIKEPLLVRLWRIVSCRDASDSPGSKRPDMESDSKN